MGKNPHLSTSLKRSQEAEERTYTKDKQLRREEMKEGKIAIMEEFKDQEANGYVQH